MIEARFTDVTHIVADFYGVAAKDLLSGAHRIPRSVAMYFARRFTAMSFRELSRRFACTASSTVLLAAKRIEDQSESDPKLSADVTEIESRIRQYKAMPELWME